MTRPIKLALLWHMHQPNYQKPGSDSMVLPWVRLHGTKDYLDMLQAATAEEGIRVTFNLVPSLIEQFKLYAEGATDPHLQLSRAEVEDLSDDDKGVILDTFFSAHVANMIEPYPRYNQLYRKARPTTGSRAFPALFSREEIQDLQVWSNLVWVDPTFRYEEPIRELLAQGRQFSREQKHALLDWQLDHLSKIVPAYKKAFADDRIEISFTPYYHPILPLLCDSQAALESTPQMTLPSHRFRHPEDAARQIEMSQLLFEKLFGRPMQGMWPSEGSISAETAEIAQKAGIKWIASDEEVLRCSLEKAGVMTDRNVAHFVYKFGPGLRMFFRDHGLSDRIGFVYSGWDAKRAVKDFIAYVKDVSRRTTAVAAEDPIVSVILDGENAWEFFPDDGTEFLRLFYRELAEDKDIETVTMSEAVDTLRPRNLTEIHAGSWINHNFRIWIGHEEDNAAWDRLYEARQALIEFERNNPHADPAVKARAWRQIYIAEGSDWCWWYGDEHRGHDNERFDQIYREHLQEVYRLIGQKPPSRLMVPIYRRGAGLRAVPPDSLISPSLDGRLSHYYEWTGAGIYDCTRSGSAMQQARCLISSIRFGFDHDMVYIRLDFDSLNRLESLQEPRIKLFFETPAAQELDLSLQQCFEGIDSRGIIGRLSNILEIGIERRQLWEQGYGELRIRVALTTPAGRMETWPDDEPISLTVSKKGDEMFWPV